MYFFLLVNAFFFYTSVGESEFFHTATGGPEQLLRPANGGRPSLLPLFSINSGMTFVHLSGLVTWQNNF